MKPPDEQTPFNPLDPRGWWDYLSQKPGAFSWGGVEIFCLGPHQTIQVATACAEMLAHCINKDNPERVFDSIHIILPPTLESAQDIYDIIATSYDRSATADLEDLKSRIKKRIAAHISTDLDGQRLAQLAASLGDKSAALIVDADLYETGIPTLPSPHANSSESPSQPGFHFDDWPWSDRIARLTEALVEDLRDRQSMAILLSQQFAPIHKNSVARILGVDGSGVTTQSPSYIQVISAQEERWAKMIRLGKTEAVLTEINELPLDDFMRAQLRAQALFSAGAPGAGLEEVESYIETLKTAASPTLLLKLAIMAIESAQIEKSLRLLRDSIARGIDEETQFRTAISLARRLGASQELSELRRQISLLLPFSDTGVREAFLSCSAPADFANFIAEARKSLRGRTPSGTSLFLTKLASEFAKGNYEADFLAGELRKAYPHHADEAILIIADREIRRGRHREAAYICISHTWSKGTESERSAIRLLLESVEGLLLRMGEQSVDDDIINYLSTCFRFVANYLFQNPEDSTTKRHLVKLASPHTGPYGYTMLGHMASQDLLYVEPDGLYEPSTSEEVVPDEIFLGFLKKSLEATDEEGIVLLGQGLALETPGYSARRLLDQVWRMIQTLDVAGADDSHCDILLKLLHVGLVLARKVARPGEVSQLIGRVAISLSLSGYGQMARDLAEHIMLMVTQSNRNELLFAWLEYAEIYLRLKRPQEAIVWLSVALSRADAPWPCAASYHSAFLTARILRDLSMYDLAIKAANYAKDLAQRVGLHGGTVRRLDFLEASIEVAQLQQERFTAERDERILGLGNRLVYRLAEGREEKDELLPYASLLASLVMKMSTAGLETSAFLVELRKTAESLYGHAKIFLLSLIDPPTTSGGIAEFARGLRRTRDPEDAISDVYFLPVLARNALGRAEVTSEIERLALLEWLTDRSIQAPSNTLATSGVLEARNYLARELAHSESKDGLRRELGLLQELLEQSGPTDAVHVPPDAFTLAEFAGEMSTRGVDLHAFGLVGSSEIRLALVSAVGGHLMNVEVTKDVFDVEAFSRWKNTYPYGYKSNSPSSGQDINDVERSLQGIGIPLGDSTCPALLIPEAGLQIIPPNFVLSDGTLSGLRRPMASAPSLTWLRSMNKLSREPNCRRAAWIPSSPTSSNGNILNNPLEMLTSTLEAVLSGAGFSMSSDVNPPAALRSADVAIVGAHGAVEEMTDWFRAIADENNLRLSPIQLAESLAGATLVILFICSGGRLDPHPFASAVMGLPQTLLSRGCRAVIASPWPLAVTVPQYWLPAFLNSWDGGATVVEANFLANQAVAKSYSFHPSHSLAMNLFGDPLFSNPRRDECGDAAAQEGSGLIDEP